MWLHRNDNDWLNNNSPKPKRKVNYSSLDSKREDTSLLIKVKDILKKWSSYEVERPIRKTKHGVLKRLNKVNFYNKHEALLPKTRKYLKRETETKEAFQIRRIKKAIQELKNEFGIIKEYMVYERASLKQNVSIEIKKVIQVELFRIAKLTAGDVN